MSLETKIVALAQAIGADIKTINANAGDLSSLSTTAKNNLVAAINELNTYAGGLIYDGATPANSTETTWSSTKINDTIEAAKTAVKTDLIGGASEALDTFKELQDALGNDPTFATTVANSLNKRLRFDEAQTLTAPEKLTACTNIGVGDPTHDYVADYTTAKTPTPPGP